ncbi:MAG: DUF664 domain-containing protein [Gemmatimonadota bacterium]
MTRQDFALIFARDLATLRAEVLSYPDDASVWALPPGAPNSGGTLVLHLCGNLRHFIGADVGGSGYVRDRDTEFQTRGTSRADLAALVHVTEAEVAHTMRTFDEAHLDDPMTFGATTCSRRRGMLHLAVHLTYHLGQLDYHRRLVTRDVAGVSALPLAPLAL